MPVLLIIVAVIIVAGALVLLRDSPADSAEKPAPELLSEVRAKVVELLAPRLRGWELSPDPQDPAKLSLRDEAVDRRIEVNLEELTGRWEALNKRELVEEAQELLQSFVENLLGPEHAEESEFDPELAHHALALRLFAEQEVPAGALKRQAGPLSAVLVLRNPQGPELLGEADLAALGLGRDEAFARALQNHSRDVEDGPLLSVAAGSEQSPLVLEIAAGDPLAGSLALTPEAHELAQKKLGADPLFLLASPSRFYALSASGEALQAALALAGDKSLMKEALSPKLLRLKEEEVAAIESVD